MLFLRSNEVHIYSASLSFLLNNNHDEVRSFLTQKEKKRINSFKNQDDINRFIIARYIVRIVLEYYTGIDFRGIDFIYTIPYKKPILAIKENNIDFSISHSNDLIVVAFSRTPIGIDVELKHKKYTLNHLVLTQAEQQKLKCLPNPMATERFFKIWTNKEAYTKAMGMGLFFPINTIEIKFGNECNKIMDLEGNIDSNFFLKDINTFNDSYSVTLAVIDKNLSINIYDFAHFISVSKQNLPPS